jgi:hypothetical protein
MLLDVLYVLLSNLRKSCEQLVDDDLRPPINASPETVHLRRTVTYVGMNVYAVLVMCRRCYSAIVDISDDDRGVLRDVLGDSELQVFPRLLSDLAAPFSAIEEEAYRMVDGCSQMDRVPVESFASAWEKADLSEWKGLLAHLRRICNQVEIAGLLKFKRTIASLANATAAPVTSSTAGQSDSRTTIQPTDSNNIASIPAQPAAKAMPRLRVARQDGQHVIVLDGKPYLVSHTAWRLFEAMIGACPQFIHASKLNPSVRPDEVDKMLPKTLRKMAANESVNSTKAIWMSGKAVGCRLLINPNDPEKHAPT